MIPLSLQQTIENMLQTMSLHPAGSNSDTFASVETNGNATRTMSLHPTGGNSDISGPLKIYETQNSNSDKHLIGTLLEPALTPPDLRKLTGGEVQYKR